MGHVSTLKDNILINSVVINVYNYIFGMTIFRKCGLQNIKEGSYRKKQMGIMP